MMSGAIEWAMRQNGNWPAILDVPPEDGEYSEPSDPTKQYIVLKNKYLPGSPFFSMMGKDRKYRSDWYEEIACVDTIAEAQRACGYNPDHT